MNDTRTHVGFLPGGGCAQPGQELAPHQREAVQ